MARASFGTSLLWSYFGALLLVTLIRASPERELRQIKEMLRRREAADLQQKIQISRLAENLQALTATMERYVNLLEDGVVQGRDGDGDGVGSCSTQMALIQNKLNTFQGSVTQQLDRIEERIENVPGNTCHSDTDDELPQAQSSCAGRLASIDSAVDVGAARSRYWWGYWGHDVMREDGIIYVGSGNPTVTTVREYLNENDLRDKRIHQNHTLSPGCVALSILVRNRRLFCTGQTGRNGETIGIMMYNLDTDHLIKQKTINFEVKQLYRRLDTKIDLSADGSRIWMTYAPESQAHVRLDQLDPESLETLATWETHIPAIHIGETFMICGVLYSINSFSDSPTYIKHVFNTRQGTNSTLAYQGLVMPSFDRNCWANLYPAYIGMARYDRWEQALYAWNCGYLEKYPLRFEQ